MEGEGGARDCPCAEEIGRESEGACRGYQGG